MTTALKLQFTEAGLTKLLDAKSHGLRGEITHIAFGENSYTPTKNQRFLGKEKERVEISDYQGDGQNLRMAAVFQGELEYAIREVGIFLADGTLLGVYSEPGKTLGYRTPAVRIVQWFTLNISALPTDSVTVSISNDSLNLIIDEELAKMATAQISTMHRQIRQEYRLLALEQK
ncbi:hypothetical protein A8319_002479 [Escherichia coli]|nr:hypothetical protein [Escherichia coli]